MTNAIKPIGVILLLCTYLNVQGQAISPPTGDGYFLTTCDGTDFTATATPGTGGTEVEWFSDYLCTTSLSVGETYSGDTDQSFMLYAATKNGDDISADPKQVYIFKPANPVANIELVSDELCGSVDLIVSVDTLIDSLEIFVTEDATIDPTAAGTNFNNDLLNVRANGFCGGNVKFLFKWDLSPIPDMVSPDSSIMTATAYAGFAHGGDGRVYTKTLLFDTWDEETVTHATAPAESPTNHGHWWIWYGWPSFGTAHAASDNTMSMGASPEGNKTRFNNREELNDIVTEQYELDDILSTYHWSPGYDTKYYSKDYKTDESLLPKMKIIFDYNYASACTYSWTGPGGFTSDEKDLIGVSETGTYVLTVTSEYGCETTLEQYVEVPDEDAMVLDATTENVCDGDTDGSIDLTVTGGTPDYTFDWETGATDEDLTDLTAGTYTITVTDINGCERVDSFTIEVLPNPVVDLGPDSSFCDSDYNLDAENPGATYLWQDGSTDQLLTASETGTYWVIVTNDDGCVEADSVDLIFDTSPNAGLGYDTTLCNNAGAINLNDLLSIDADSDGDWAETSGDPSGTFDPATGNLDLTTITAGNYTFTYTTSTIEEICPDDVSTFTVNVSEIADAGSDNTQSLCANDDAFNLNTLLSPGVLGGTWTETTASGQFNPATGELNPAGLAGDFNFIYVLESAAPCPNDTSYFTLTVTTPPVLAISPEFQEGCVPFTANIENLSTYSGSGICTWEISDGSLITGICPSIAPTFDIPGCYSLTLTVEDENGCINSETYPDVVCARPVPSASFIYDPGVIHTDDPTIHFENLSYDADSYTWYFGDGGSSNDEHPVHNYPNSLVEYYNVLLVAENEYGCVDSIDKNIEVRERILFYIPNTFTPDGDSFNELFKPIMTSGFDPYDFHFTIYNRWGELIFESYNANTGWDGTYGGNLCPDGVYVWNLQFGNPYTDQNYVYTGHLNLLK